MYTRARRSPRRRTSSRCRRPIPMPEGRRPVGVEIDGRILRGFPTPSGRLEFYSPTLAELGLAGATRCRPTSRSHVHPDELAEDEMSLISTFRLPVQIHTRRRQRQVARRDRAHEPALAPPCRRRQARRSHRRPRPRRDRRSATSCVKAWVTEGIRPGVVACSHHMGRWKLARARPATDDGHGRPRAARGAAGRCAARRASGPTPRPTPTRCGSGGATSACTRT